MKQEGEPGVIKKLIIYSITFFFFLSASCVPAYSVAE